MVLSMDIVVRYPLLENFMYVIVDSVRKRIVESWSHLAVSEVHDRFMEETLAKLNTMWIGRNLQVVPVHSDADLAPYQTKREDDQVWFWLFNYTPHTIHLVNTGGVGGTEQSPLPIESSGVARADEVCEELTPIRHDYFGDSGMYVDVPLVSKRYGAVTGLPEPQPHTLYIVSDIVQLALPERRDLVSPHDLVRDDQKRIIGCRGFSRRAG